MQKIETLIRGISPDLDTKDCEFLKAGIRAEFVSAECACTFCGEPAHKNLVDRDGVCPRCQA